MVSSPKKPSLFPLIFTVFIDLVGVGIVIPILAPLLLGNNPLFSFAGMDEFWRAIILGLLIASYPFAQFFGAPMLGVLSDKYGRKKLLLISLGGTFFGYILFALAILNHNLILLFVSRLLDGFTGGNISIANSAIADLSKPEDKAKNFGLVGMAFGLGFILGPFIGGKLSDTGLVSWFGNDTPFWFAAILCALNMGLLSLFFHETLQQKTTKSIGMLDGVRNLYRAFTDPTRRRLFFMIFLIMFGFNCFTQFFNVFLIQKFNFTQSQIGDFFAYTGLWIAIAQGFIIRPFLKKHKPLQILNASLLVLAASLVALLLPPVVWPLFFVTPFIAISYGLTYPTSSAVISNMSKPEEQGETLGIQQSMQAVGQTIPPLVSGFLIALNLNLPILLGSFCILMAWLVVRGVKTEGKV